MNNRLVAFLLSDSDSEKEVNKASPSYNYGNNILRSFDDLPNFSFTTSETKPKY